MANIITINQIGQSSSDLSTADSNILYINVDSLNDTDFTAVSSGDLVVFVEDGWSDIQSIVLSSRSSNSSGNYLLIDGEAYFSESLTVSGITLPSQDSTANYGIKTDGSGNLSFAEVNLSSSGASSLVPFVESLSPSTATTNVSTTIQLNGQNLDQETRFYFFSGTPSESDLSNLTNTVDAFLEDAVSAGLVSSKTDPGYFSGEGVCMTNYTYSSTRNPFVIFSSDLVKFSVNSTSDQSLSIVAANGTNVYYYENALIFSAYVSITFDNLSGGDWSAVDNNLYAGSGSVNNSNLIRSNETFDLSTSSYGYRYRWTTSGTQPTNTGFNYTTDTGESLNWQSIRYQVSTNGSDNLNARVFGSGVDSIYSDLKFQTTAPSGSNRGDKVGFSNGTVLQINIQKTDINDDYGTATLQYVETQGSSEIWHDIYTWPYPVDASKTLQTAHALDWSNTSILDNRVYNNSSSDITEIVADNSVPASFPAQSSPYFVAGNNLFCISGTNQTSNLIVSNESFSLNPATNPDGVKFIFTLDGRQPASWGLRYTDDSSGTANWEKSRWWFITHNSRIDLGSFGSIANTGITWPSRPPNGFSSGATIPYSFGTTYAIYIKPDANGTTGTVKLQYVFESSGSTEYFDIYTWSNAADLTKSIEAVFSITNEKTGARNISFLNGTYVFDSTYDNNFTYDSALPSAAVLFLDASNSDSYSGTGTAWIDLSEEWNDGTLVNSPSYSSTTKLFTFTGSNYVSLPSGFSDFSNGITLFFVANFGTTNVAWERLIDLSTGSASNNIIFCRQNTTGDLLYNVYNGSSVATNVIVSGGISSNTLATYAVIDDGVNIKIYRDGSLIKTASSSLPPNVNRTQNYIARSAWNDGYMQGSIGAALVWNKALTATELETVNDYFDTQFGISAAAAAAAAAAAEAAAAAAAAASPSEVPWNSASGITIWDMDGDGTDDSIKPTNADSSWYETSASNTFTLTSGCNLEITVAPRYSGGSFSGDYPHSWIGLRSTTNTIYDALIFKSTGARVHFNSQNLGSNSSQASNLFTSPFAPDKSSGDRSYWGWTDATTTPDNTDADNSYKMIWEDQENGYHKMKVYQKGNDGNYHPLDSSNTGTIATGTQVRVHAGFHGSAQLNYVIAGLVVK